MEKEALYREAAKKWGDKSQIYMLAEECCELAHAAHHLLRDAKNTAHFAEEIADVEIMIEQAVSLLKDPYLRPTIERFKKVKLERLEETLLKA